MGEATFPINWLQSLTWGDRSRLTRLSYQTISVPVLAAGAFTEQRVTLPASHVAMVVYDIRPASYITPNVWSWEIMLAGDILHGGVVSADGYRNLLLVTEHDRLSMRLVNNGPGADFFLATVNYVAIQTGEGLEMLRAQLAQLGTQTRVETLLEDVVQSLKKIYDAQNVESELVLSAPAPPFTPQEIEEMRGQRR